MRLYQSAVFVSLSSVALAILKCPFEVEGINFDLSELKGAYSIDRVVLSPPKKTNTTWTINPCGPIQKDGSPDLKKECPNGTQVCGIERVTKDDDVSVSTHPIPIAGDINGKSGKVETTRLKTSKEPADAGKEGIRVVLGGGSDGGKDQEAVVEFLCDPKKSGLEGLKPEKEGGDEGKEKGEEKQPEEKDSDEKSLTFISYDNHGSDKGVLKLEWKTKYACESREGGGGADQGSHWGFFTWFIIILFLGVAAYLIFGSWLNYNRYGSRGWDLLPHSDTIRDLPYLLKDWARRVIGTLQGRGGGRGGYSAV